MHSFDWGQFIASTFSVLLVLAAVWWWVKRNRALLPSSMAERRIQIVEAMPLSLKHKMVLIQVDDQMVLATVSPGEVKTLHAWAQGDGHAA
jgi:flagellar biogenesis protein FliO